MQSLEVISINLWQILIAGANLAILFAILKRFLYKPVQKAAQERQAELDRQYARAEDAQRKAGEAQKSWETRMRGAEEEAAAVRREAKRAAGRSSEAMLADARRRAEQIVRDAESAAELERRRAGEDMRREIVDTSAAMTENLLRRRMTDADQQALIDAFLEEEPDAPQSKR